VLITSLQIGYVFGLVSHSIPSVSERRGPRPRRRPEPRHQPAPRANFPYDIADANEVASGEHVGFLALPANKWARATPMNTKHC
jgi:hypothetical protein